MELPVSIVLPSNESVKYLYKWLTLEETKLAQLYNVLL